MTQPTAVNPGQSGRPAFFRRPGPTTAVTVLLYSDDRTVREFVRSAVGDRLSSEGPAVEWVEIATGPEVVTTVESRKFDLLILDGEAQKDGGMGLCRQLKNEIYRCPEVLVLTARPDDEWLATWSLADAVVSRPFDAVELHEAVSSFVSTPAS